MTSFRGELPMTFSRLIADVRGRAPEVLGAPHVLGAPRQPSGDPVITALVHDHRTVTAGALFVARKGERFDGHEVIAQALERGAAAVIGERPPVELSVELGAVPYLRVPDSRRALPFLAAAFHEHPSERLRVIGVTGTDGKTTTSFLLHRILEGRYRSGLISTAGVRLGSQEGALLGHFTTPEATDVQRLLAEFAAAGARHAVLESSSHGFSLNRLDAVSYAAGVVTNVSPEHLDHHKTLSAYLDAKATLVKRAARAVINLDDEHRQAFLEAAKSAGSEIVTYGQHRDADVRLGKVTDVPGGLLFELVAGGEATTVKLPLIGGYNAWNAAAAMAVTLGEGISLAEAAARLESFSGVPGRMQVLQAEPFTVVVDFAHTAPALAKALAAVRRERGRVIVVIGAAGERDPGKRAPLGSAAVGGADLVIFTEEDSRSEPFSLIAAELKRGALAAGGSENGDFVIIQERERAIAEALHRAGDGDVVVLAGKGHERTLERSDEVIAWDEAALARRLLAG